MTTTAHTSTKQDILQYLLRESQATASDLAKALDISPQATRRHLKDLETEGLIEYQSIQQGMGRPQHIYTLSRKGRDRFPHRYGEFAVSFLNTLAETVGEDQVSEVFRKQWQRKAHQYHQNLQGDSLKDRVKHLVQLRKEEGYMAELYPVEGQSEQFVLVEHNCAISEVAESYPNVCEHELEMFTAVLPDCQVKRTQWIIDGEPRCGYLIQSTVNP